MPMQVFYRALELIPSHWSEGYGGCSYNGSSSGHAASGRFLLRCDVAGDSGDGGAGLWADLFYRGTVFAKLPSVLVHVHGAVFSSWVLLYVAQTVLVWKRKIRWHRQLGTFGGVLAGLMVILGWAATLQNVARGRTPEIFTPAEFLVINLWGILLFGGMVAWGIVKRRDGAAHKRLMLLGTIGIMPPAITRIMLTMGWPGLTVPIWMLGMCGAVFVFDTVTRKRPHWATVVGTAVSFSVPITAGILKHDAVLEGVAARLMAWR
jgi:hypothetical protein